MLVLSQWEQVPIASNTDGETEADRGGGQAGREPGPNAFKVPEQLVGLPWVIVSSLSLKAFKKDLDSHLSKQLSKDFQH